MWFQKSPLCTFVITFEHKPACRQAGDHKVKLKNLRKSAYPLLPVAINRLFI